MIEQVVTPVTHDLGAFKVRRALPARERTMVGPFIFVDEFGPAQLRPGDVVAGVNRIETTDLAALQRQLAEPPSRLVLTILRGGGAWMLEVR